VAGFEVSTEDQVAWRETRLGDGLWVDEGYDVIPDCDEIARLGSVRHMGTRDIMYPISALSSTTRSLADREPQPPVGQSGLNRCQPDVLSSFIVDTPNCKRTLAVSFGVRQMTRQRFIELCAKIATVENEVAHLSATLSAMKEERDAIWPEGAAAPVVALQHHVERNGKTDTHPEAADGRPTAQANVLRYLITHPGWAKARNVTEGMGLDGETFTAAVRASLNRLVESGRVTKNDSTSEFRAVTPASHAEGRA